MWMFNCANAKQCSHISSLGCNIFVHTHRLLLDSEPRQKAWEMAQKIVSDINKLEKYLAKNQLGQVQPHAIGNNTMFCYDCLIGYYGEKGRVKLSPQAVSCIK